MNDIGRRVEEGSRRPTNVSLGEALIAEAREPGINGSRACEQRLEAEVRRERTRRWQHENTAGFDAWNDYAERNGVPLDRYRKF